MAGTSSASPSTLWGQVFGEAFSSPGMRRRNKKLHALTPDQLEEIREAFKLFDTDDSGTIDSDGAFFRNFFPSLSVTCTLPPPC